MRHVSMDSRPLPQSEPGLLPGLPYLVLPGLNGLPYLHVEVPRLMSGTDVSLTGGFPLITLCQFIATEGRLRTIADARANGYMA